jgi:hypothetical protein
MRRVGRCVTFGICIALTSASVCAEAQSVPAPPTAAAPSVPAPPLAASPNPAPPLSASEWYGWQILMVDAAALVTSAIVANVHRSDADSLGLFAGTWYGVSLIGAPAVHWAHGRTAAGWIDFSMRGFAPPLAAVFGLAASCLGGGDSFDDLCSSSGWSVGSLVGSAGAAAIDALLLARTDAAPQPPSAWYGLQIMAVDVAGYAAGVFLTARRPHTESGKMHPALSLWLMNYVVGLIGAPIVHFVHGEVERGFGSLGMRFLVGPLGAVFGLMGFCAATAGATDCAGDGAQWGLLGGGLSVALFDALILAHASAPNPKPSASNVGLTLGAGTIGLNGRW